MSKRKIPILRLFGFSRMQLSFGLLIVCIGHVTSSSGSSSSSSSTVSSASPRSLQVPKECRWDSSYEGGLICLQTEPAASRVNFSQIPAVSVTMLSLYCISDDLASANGDSKVLSLAGYDRTIIEPEELAHFWRLRAVRVIGCRVNRLVSKALNGLRDLRNLTIRTDSGELEDDQQDEKPVYQAKFALELGPGAFDTVTQLEKLDLSFNNIWQIPSQLFCPLANLVSLNLSNNLLEDLAELNFGSRPERKPRRLDYQSQPRRDNAQSTLPPPNSHAPSSCFLDLRVLDLSRNGISTVPARVFSSLRRLSALDLSGNDLTVVEDDAFYGLRSLKSIDLSENRIVALPVDVFREAANTLKDLKLQNNSITALAPGLITDMNQLVSLDLSKNMLSSSFFNSATFAGLIRLVLLDLSFNQIDRLDPALFKDLYTLQILNLKYNEIETIPPDTFVPMSNLHTLEMSHNRLKNLDAQSLNGLFALSLLAMNYNLLEGIHQDAFKNCSSIQDVQLSGNALDTVPSALRDMGILKMLDLGENRIENLERSNFEGMSGLYGLRLMNNYISNVSKDAFVELPALQILNLARNKIEHVDSEAFKANFMLQAIRLDCNLLESLSPFANVNSLLWLNVSDNMIERFEFKQLPSQLQWLDLHKNVIGELGIALSSSRLQTLDASFNRLSRISGRSIPTSIELLFLNDNQIHTIEPQTFVDKPNLTRVDLYANQIERMELSSLQLSQFPPDKLLPEFYIGGNPFACDCTTEWLQRINQLNLRQHPRVMDLASVYCRLPYDRRQGFVPLLEAKSSQFLCVYTTHCFALCHCCDFDACDCEMICPANCSCYHDQTWTANVVDCSRAGYKGLPGRLPMDATEVYLDGNDLAELGSHAFIGRKNLEILYANDSRIVSIRNHTFSGLKRLLVLHLENNRLELLRGVEFAPLESLRELYLQNNLLAHVDNATFQPLRKLEILRLEGNRLSNFALWRLRDNPYLVEVGLAENPWHCGCGYLDQVRQWMQSHHEKIADWKKSRCSLGIALLEFNGTIGTGCAALESFSTGMRGRGSLDGQMAFALIAIALLVGILALLCGALRNRRSLRAWAASRCGLRACYKTAAFEDREKPFDAYISYSAVDEAFVSRVLVPGLESSYRLCLHYRDLGAGSSVAEAVAEAADSSRRTILVLSRNFLRGEWSRFEFKLALREALRGRGRSVILILVGGVCPRDLDVELRRRLSCHTVLVWGDKIFWQKLRFAMPDVAPLMERPPSLPTPPPPPQHLWA